MARGTISTRVQAQWLSFAAVVALAACGGGGDSGNGAPVGIGPPAPAPSPAPPPPPPINPQPTAVGIPTGAAVTQTIGASGGTIASADGAVTLSLPAGALGSDTTIGVQPITNFAINGVGTAYRFTPEGTTFTQPVTLTFAYTDAMTAGSAPQYSAQHVEVTWTAAVPNPLAEVGGVLYYGTAGYWATTVNPNNLVCDSQTVTEDLAAGNDGNPASTLEVYDGKYRFSIFTKQILVPFTCSGQPAPTYIEQNILIDGCPSDQQALAGAPTYSDANVLAQSGFHVATGSPADGCRLTTSATWKFTPN